MSTIKSSTTNTTAYQVVADTTGALVIQTGATPTTAITVGADQSVTFAGAVSTTGNQTLTGNLTVNGNTTLGDASTDTILMTGAPSIGGAGLGMGMGFRNRIINGAMVIDQRNAGAAGTAGINTAPYGVDRWWVFGQLASKFTYQQNAGAVTPPTGFSNYFGMTSSSAYAIVAGDRYVVAQSIEGNNTYDLDFGKATAKTITISFWVYSSLTGTFGGSLQNYAGTRSYPFTYSISVANTWEQKTVTIAGDTSGTWVGASNAGSMTLFFSLGSGSTYSGTAGAWATANYTSATGSTSVVGTNGATFYITGVQLEKGSTATSFDYRPYGTELALCQRYYQSINFSEAQGSFTKWATGVCYSTTGIRVNVPLLVKMRTYPSLVVTSTASNYGIFVTTDVACNSVPTINTNTNPSIATVELSVASGLTAGNAVLAQANANQTAYVGFNAEL